ncbi:MAG: 16S rRNA (adenine(1518)-N(6)/adenine(1519)-N(6))-dimethyltransferase RsmA [bacterium]
MDLSSLKTIKYLLKEHKICPEKRLGQHFLADRMILAKIIKAAELEPGDVVLEIGPGIGTLTQELAKAVKKVLAVEKDSKMCQVLRELLENLDIKNVEIVQADIRTLESKIKDYKLVANLPYYIASPVIRKFLEAGNPPKLMVLMVQKEVAQRICAKPPNMNLLAVSVQFYSQPEIISYVSKKSFWPQPKVDSAIIKITPNLQNIQRTGLCVFFNIVRAGFAHPRKQLINNLSTGLSIPRPQAQIWLQKNKILPEQRAETLTLKNWVNLTKSFRN